jgi:4-amino-4-deoxychorismate lyase
MSTHSLTGTHALVMVDPVSASFRLADSAAPQLRVDDLAPARGDGVFETMLVKDGVRRAYDPHLARFVRSAAMLDLAEPELQLWRDAIDAALEAHGPAPEIMVRFVLGRGIEGTNQPSGWVLTSEPSETVLNERENGVAVLTLDRGFDSTAAERAPWLQLGAKTLSYAINMGAVRYAKKNGAQDVIFLTSDGVVLEGPTSTVIVANGHTLRTPRPETGTLTGTTQGDVFAAAAKAGWDVGFAQMSKDDLLSADALWLASSVRLLAPVTSIDGVAVKTSPELTADVKSLIGL